MPAMAGPTVRPSSVKHWSDTDSILSEDERTLPGYDDEDDDFYAASNASFSSLDTFGSYPSVIHGRPFRVPKGTNPSKPVYEAWIVWDDEYECQVQAKPCTYFPQAELGNMHLKAMSKYHESHKSFLPFRGKKTYEADMDARIRKAPFDIQEGIGELLDDRQAATTTPWRIRDWSVVMMQEQLCNNFTTSEPQVVKRHRFRRWKNNDRGQPTQFFCIIRGVEKEVCHDEVGFPTFNRLSNPWKHTDNEEVRRWNRVIRAKQRRRRFFRFPPPPPPGPVPAPAPVTIITAQPPAPKARTDRAELRQYIPPPPASSSHSKPPPPPPPPAMPSFPATSSSQPTVVPMPPQRPTSPPRFFTLHNPNPSSYSPSIPTPSSRIRVPTDLDLRPNQFHYARSTSEARPPPRAPTLQPPSFDPYTFSSSPGLPSTFPAPPAFPLFPEYDLPKTLRPPALPQDVPFFHLQGPPGTSGYNPSVHSTALKYSPLVEPVRANRLSAGPTPMPRATEPRRVTVMATPPASIPSPPATEASRSSSTSQKIDKTKSNGVDLLNLDSDK